MGWHIWNQFGRKHILHHIKWTIACYAYWFHWRYSLIMYSKYCVSYSNSFNVYPDWFDREAAASSKRYTKTTYHWYERPYHKGWLNCFTRINVCWERFVLIDCLLSEDCQRYMVHYQISCTRLQHVSHECVQTYEQIALGDPEIRPKCLFCLLCDSHRKGNSTYANNSVFSAIAGFFG